MKMFIIPYSYTVCGEFNIQAETLEKAIELAEDYSLNHPNEEYIGNSFKVDLEVAYHLNEVKPPVELT